MKKLLFPLIALLAITCACTSDKADTGDAADATVTIDSFYSPDLAFAQLRGPVKECSTTTTDVVMQGDSLAVTDESTTTTEVLRFSPSGMINSLQSSVVFLGENVESSGYTFEYDADGNFVRAFTSADGILRIKRHPGGQINTFASLGATGDIEFVKAYVWDGNLLTEEFLVNNDYDGASSMKDVKNKITYTYDDNGYRTASHEEFGDPEFGTTVTETTFDSQTFDDHGNWTSRVVKKVANVYAGTYQGDGNHLETVTTYLTESRTITYY